MPQKREEFQKREGKPSVPKLEYENYLIFLHKKKVEVHVVYGNTVLKFQGILRTKARYDIQLIIDEEKKEIITINKAYVVMVKPI